MKNSLLIYKCKILNHPRDLDQLLSSTLSGAKGDPGGGVMYKNGAHTTVLVHTYGCTLYIKGTVSGKTNSWMRLNGILSYF